MAVIDIGVLSSSQVIGLPVTATDIQSVTVSGELQVRDGDTLEVGPLVIRLQGRIISCLGGAYGVCVV